MGTEIFQDENNGLDSVSAAGAKLRDVKTKLFKASDSVLTWREG